MKINIYLQLQLTILLFCAVPLRAQLNTNIVASYLFNDGTANDGVGINHGQAYGTTLTTDRFGNPGTAYYFNGNARVELPNAPALKSNTMTVSLWVKVVQFNTSLTTQNFIYSVINSTSQSYFSTFAMSARYYDNSFFSVTQNSSSATFSEISYNTPCQLNTWQHYVLGISPDSVVMYIDNQLQWKVHKSFLLTFNNGPIFIGASGNTSYPGNLTGAVDDIRVYKKLLNAAEVDSLFNEPSPTIPLPVDLMAFSGRRENNAHYLYWNTATEENTDHFVLQRSADGQAFVNIGIIAASGSSNHQRDYSFIDLNPLPDNNFYRLKVVDADGAFTYSTVVSIKGKESLSLQVYPNPTAGMVYFTEPVDVVLSDICSRILTQEKQASSLDISAYPAGVYSLLLGNKSKDHQQRVKLIKK